MHLPTRAPKPRPVKTGRSLGSRSSAMSAFPSELISSSMHQNGDGLLERPEAVAFWGKNFAKVNANAMFNEVTRAPPSLPTTADRTGTTL